jgi:hypothetical protein
VPKFGKVCFLTIPFEQSIFWTKLVTDRPIRYTRPRKISDVVANLLAKRGYGRVLALDQYAELWLAVAGPHLAEKSRATDVKRGVLQIAAGNSAVMQELIFQRHVLIKKLKEIAPEQKIIDLKIKVISLE